MNNIQTICTQFYQTFSTTYKKAYKIIQQHAYNDKCLPKQHFWQHI